MLNRFVVLLFIWLAMVFPARAAIIYSGLADISIPTTFDGIYLDIETGFTSGSEFVNWDINPFFGGVGVANSDTFQPARVGTGNEDDIVRYNVGQVVGGSLLYSTDFGGSDSHVGNGSGQFAVGAEGYIGFRFNTNDGLNTYYGWMRVIFTNNAAGALIRDWAYEDSGGTLVTGRVHQSPASMGVKLTTLSPATGESFTLGSAVADPGGGVVGSILKTGAGTAIFAATKTYTGATTITGGTLEIATGGLLSGTASVAVNTGGTLLFSGTGGVNARVNSAATVALGGGKISASGVTSSLDQQFGTLTLSDHSTIDFGTLAGGNTIRLADSSGATWTAGKTLSIWNWTLGADHLFFGTNSSGLIGSQLTSIAFYSDSGVTQIGSSFDTQFTGALGEVAPIPEPAGAAFGFVMCGLAAWRERRRTRALLRAGRAGVPAGNSRPTHSTSTQPPTPTHL